VLSLAIGVGATTSIFSVAEALLFRPPAGVAEADRLVDIGFASDGLRIGTVSFATYLAVRQRAATLQDVYAYPVWPSAMSLMIRDEVERVYADTVTPNFFGVVGASPAEGRFFDDRDGVAVVVLSYRLWASRFDRSPAAVGQTIRLNGAAYTVLGVAREHFQGTTIRLPDLWIPLDVRGGSRAHDRAAASSLLLGARLKPGVSRARASAEIDAVGRALERESPEQNGRFKLRAVALSTTPDIRGPLALFLALLFAIVAIVLAVACTNFTGILLARGASRRREFAMRLAIGASRSRLVRQLLVETVLVFAIACAAGLLLATWFTALLAVMLPVLPVPVGLPFGLDIRAFGFAAGVSLIAALLSGLIPAVQASKVDLISAMRHEPSLRIGGMRLRNTFVTAQLALSIVLIVIGALFVRALNRVASTDPGFTPEGIEVVDLDLSIAGYSETSGPVFAHDLLDRIRSVPGVAAATLAFVPPGAFEGLGLGISVSDPGTAGGRRSFDAGGNIVAPGYFATLGIPLLAGRDFAASDRHGAQPVAIVSETTARRLWPDRDARSVVGELVFRASGGTTTTSLLVIGVAGNVTYNSLIDGARDLFVYVPLDQEYLPRMSIVTRASDGRSLRPSIARLVGAMNPNLPIVASATVQERIRTGQTPQRIVASLSVSLGMVGLLLSAMGIYGVTAYSVATRTKEIGVRMALGARAADVVALVLRYGMSLVLIGGLIGLGIAAAASQLLRSLLFGIPALDPISFGGTAALFGAVGLFACYVPLRRATRINIADTLRFE
jgi:putative ABC transport system permease protein